jgi:hypothetical protein
LKEKNNKYLISGFLMSELKNTLLLEYLNLSDVQRFFYFNTKPDADEEEIESRFFYNPKKISWSTNIQLSLLSQREGFNYVYIPDNNFHLLAWTCLVWKLPRISVKKEYRNKIEICWVDNLAICLIKEAQLYFGNKKIQGFDSFCLCILHKFLMKDKQKRKTFSKIIGNRKNLTNWTNTLESNIIILPQPWYYSKDEVHAFPLFLCKTKLLKHKYIFRDKIQELLRMRILINENQWKELQDINISYLDLEQDTLSPPDMIGKYINLSEEEYEYRKETSVSYFFNDFVKFVEESPKKASEFVSLDINIIEPCQCIFFLAENLNNNRLRRYTEFHSVKKNIDDTVRDKESVNDVKIDIRPDVKDNQKEQTETNMKDNIENGRLMKKTKKQSPFSTVKLVYGTSEKITEREIKFLDFIESFYHFPVERKLYKGCHGINLFYDLFSPDADSSIVFKNLSAKLLLRMKDDIEGLFKVRFYLYVVKKLEIQKDDCIIYPDITFRY